MTTPEPVFTPAAIRQDGQNRIARGGAQVSAAGWTVTLAEWAAQQVGWHGRLPTAVAAAMVGLLTIGFGYLTNRGRLRGEI